MTHKHTKPKTRKVSVLLVVLLSAAVVMACLRTDKPIRCMHVQYRGKNFFVAWCLPDRGITRSVVLMPVKMPVEKWLAQTPPGCIRAAINGPLFNSDSGVPFNEVGLGQGRWIANPGWSPCPVKRYCFGMNRAVSSHPEPGVVEMAKKTYPPSVPRDYFHVPPSFQKQFEYGFSSIGVLIERSNGRLRVCPPQRSNWEKMFPESELARSALVWTDEGDFVLVSAESATWQETGKFIARKLAGLCPGGRQCRIAGAVMLDGGSTAQFGWAYHRPLLGLNTKIPVQQANENEVVPLIVGVEARMK